MISPKGSMKGFCFKKWIIKNKDTFKLLLMAASTYITWISTQNVSEGTRMLLTGIVPIIIKLGIDALDFFASDVQL